MSIQTPIIPVPIQSLEIDKAIYQTQLVLDLNLSWLTNGYGRAYRRQKENNGKSNYVPMIYKGKVDGVPSYYQPLPDSSKGAMSFFVAGKEFYDDYNPKRSNYISWDLSIIFWMNMNVINSSLLDTEIFTQNLIRDVREVLGTKLNGKGFKFLIDEIVQDPDEVWLDFNLGKESDKLLAPYSGFRINGVVTMIEDCTITLTDQCQALLGSINNSDKNDCILPTYDFSIGDTFNSLTAQQIIDLTTQLGLATVTMTRQEFIVAGATQSIFTTTEGNLAYAHTSVSLNGDQLTSADFTLSGTGNKIITLTVEATTGDELIVLNVI